MPCESVVELIQLRFDRRERLVAYQFVKKTCGQGVGGSSLLQTLLLGLTVEELLAIDDHQLLHSCATDDEVLQFLQLKHLYAVQAAVAVLTGRAAGGKGSPCAVADISYDEQGMIIDAEIDVDMIAEKIKACQSCSGG